MDYKNTGIFHLLWCLHFSFKQTQPHFTLSEFTECILLLQRLQSHNPMFYYGCCCCPDTPAAPATSAVPTTSISIIALVVLVVLIALVAL
jgi:hypothetical protein